MKTFRPPVIEDEQETLALEGGDLAFRRSDATFGDEVPLVLVHGWCSNMHSLARQFDHFARTRPVLAVDLRGHGASAAMGGPYTVEQLAADVLALVDHVGWRGASVAGHSMGGAVAMEASRLAPDAFGAIVLLDGYGCFPDPERSQMGETLLAQVEAVGLPAVLQILVEQFFFLPGADDALKAWVHSELSSTDPATAIPLYRDLLEWDGARASTECGVPVLNLVAQAPFNPHERFLEVCPHAVAGQTVGAGHFHVFEVAGQVNSMMATFLERAAAGLVPVAPAPASGAGPGDSVE